MAGSARAETRAGASARATPAVRPKRVSRSATLGKSTDASATRIDPLNAYRSKRNFDLTPEPQNDSQHRAGELSFVVQKHWASHLHYDFRLELNGTMKSWAIPKGPSFDPKVKRMAVHVEDHPISYSSFEGTIPPKQYGAGKVIIWDRGDWSPLGDPEQGYRDGNLKFELHGQKLVGRWALVRMKGKGEKQEPWLLIKERDAFARPSEEFSVVDELLDSVNADSVSKAPSSRSSAGSSESLPAAAVKATLPSTLMPQLATLAGSAPPDNAAWLYEIKFDGYRIMTRVDADGVKHFTRNGKDWTSKLVPLRQEFERIKLPPGWYDGEIVLPGERGIPDFGALQAAFDGGAMGDAVLYLFDLPYVAGHDLRAVPLEERRAVLRRVLSRSPSEVLRFSEVFEASADSLVSSACKLGLEGVIAKRRDSRYQSARSGDWIKLKCSRRQEFVVVGYTAPQGARAHFGALILGVHDERGELQYAGNVGSGFSEMALADISKRLRPLARSTSPFPAGTKVEGTPRWVDPRLVAEVSFAEWTRSGRVRQGVFRGLRSDKAASEITREMIDQATLPETKPIAGRAAKPSAPPKSKVSAAPAQRAMSDSSLTVVGRLRVTHPERVIDESTGTRKIDLVHYYAVVGELMMAHLKHRPVSLVRAPDGVGGELFFQKHADTEKLPGIRQLDPALYISHPPLIEVVTKEGLLSAAQWNVIEFHTMSTGNTSLEHADRMVFDLDPGERVAWPLVQEAAQLLHSFLTQLGLKSFLKTSGGKGLHVVVPVRKSHDWDTVKGFSQAIVVHMAQTIPQRFVAKSGPKNRVGKIFIDYLRNGLGATTACAWSARARPGLGISVPVDWSELASLKGGNHWTVSSVHERLAVGNAPWAGYARAARNLNPAMEALGYARPTPGLSASGRKTNQS